MDLRFKTNLLEHLKAVRQWAQSRRARTSIDGDDLSLSVRLDGREHRLFAQFVGKRDGRQLAYFDVADRFAIGFVGWLPYKPQAWPISVDKLVFKATAAELGIPTPAFWREPALVGAQFLVKPSRGAFGHGIRGPYRASEAAQVSIAASGVGVGAHVEYCEEFKWGRIARAWYWCDRLAALELFRMPSVTGDGRSSYEALLRRHAGELPDDYERLARLQGVTAASVPPHGQRIVCDYRYVSPFNPTLYANHNILPRLAGSPLAQHFADAGQRLWPRIPGSADRQLGFVLDAIVDDADQPWFLEINSNPQLHPDIYAPMLDRLVDAVPG